MSSNQRSKRVGLKKGSFGLGRTRLWSQFVVILDNRYEIEQHIEDARRAVADRLYERTGNDIILLPYNPGNHWVLAVLNLKTTTCYYLDSLRPRSVDEQLRQIIDMAMAVYASESGANIRVKLIWINARPGGTECGYYVMKFMKEIAYEGVEILDNDNKNTRLRIWMAIVKIGRLMRLTLFLSYKSYFRC
ncbi:uncharacterized protein LOC110879047 isoform X2 [Helianthus annuus]|uniref:uncharacterized protein LOC110879047 isoform X2 n=1 Tax=Helianthus annuus TaxID=4232 RepID=UPI000B8F116A|nr:uncharacterized protein LOC110879047 isoform X2 [Helianthus annuus]